MKKASFIPGVAAALGMLLLILDSKTALTSAAEGIELCIRTVIPSLFPFFVLSGVLVSSMMGMKIPGGVFLGNLLGIPRGAESILITAFLGGYPVGAKAVRDAWANGQLDKDTAEHLLSFCNNAGPAFLFGMAAPMFSDSYTGWILWGIHIVGALTAGMFFRAEPRSVSSLSSVGQTSLSDALKSSLSVTAQVCGWVVLFRIVNGFLSRWILWLLPPAGQAAVAGFLELANGCLSLGSIPKEELRFLICSAILAFGGVCVTMQTVSVTRRLSLKYYFLGKLVQTAFSILLSMMYLDMISPWLLLLLPIGLLRKNAKNSRNAASVGV